MTELSTLAMDFRNEGATAAAARKIATALAAAAARGELPITIYLRGELGAGKTTLVRGVLRALGFEGRVKSPTYGLVEVYAISRLNLYHFDFYRLKDPDEWHEAGFRDSVTEQAICLIEWPEKALGARVPLPTPDLSIQLNPDAENTSMRHAIFSASSPLGQMLLQTLPP